MKIKPVPRVGLVLPTGIFYGREVLHGISEYVRTHRKWTYVTGQVDDLGEKVRDNEKVDALLGVFGDLEMVKTQERKGVIVVNVSERIAGIGTVRVLPDNHRAGQLAAAYFLEKHFTSFACTGYKEFEFCRLRMDGFQNDLKAAGHRCERFEFGEGKWERHSMEALPEIEDWIQKLPKPVAVFACTDDHARRVVNACLRMKVRVPEEVAVLGADNDEIQCELSPVPISSMAFPLRRLGYEAAAMVDHLLEGGEPPAVPVRLPPTGVVSRRSSDITAIRDPVVARAVHFISTHATDGIDVGAVVAASGASRRYVERRFLGVLGRTPKQEILRVRILKVKRLLAETNLTMPEVASAAGFTDSKMLSTVFMREMGVTPSHYRKMLRVEAGTVTPPAP